MKHASKHDVEVTFRHLLPDETTVAQAQTWGNSMGGMWYFVFEDTTRGVVAHAIGETPRGEIRAHVRGKNVRNAWKHLRTKLQRDPRCPMPARDAA